MAVTDLSSENLVYAIVQIVSSVFENMLGLATRPREQEAGPTTPQELRSIVRFTGCCAGAVSIECSRLQAQNFAARFLSSPVDEIHNQIASDVLGELTNMVAGNLKPVFAADIQLLTADSSPNQKQIAIDFVPEIQKRMVFGCAEGDFVMELVAAPMHSQPSLVPGEA